MPVGSLFPTFCNNCYLQLFLTNLWIVPLLKNSYYSSQIPTADNGMEHLFVKISNKTSKIIIGSAYISKECNVDIYAKHVQAAEHIAARYPDFGFFIIGYYNLPGVVWHPNDVILLGIKTSTRGSEGAANQTQQGCCKGTL